MRTLTVCVMATLFCLAPASGAAGETPRAAGGLSDTLYNLYVGNLHSHTSYSDGAGTPAQAFAYARDEADMDFQAVTDHHHVLTVEEYADILYQADVFTEDGVFVAIGGQEWTGIYMNHSTVWDADHVFTAPLSDYDSLYKEIVGAGCTAAFCHPQPHNFGEFAYSATGDVGINTVEVRDQQEEERYIDILSKGWHVGTDGSQDNHGPNWGNGHSWTIALACSLTRHEILEATRNHRTYSTLDRNLEMIFRAEGHYTGDEFAHVDNIAFSIEVYDPGPLDDFQRLELYQNGVVMAWIDIDTMSYAWNPTITPPSGVNHYFVKAYQKQDDMAWSSPVWIDCSTSLPATPRPAVPYDGQIVISLTPDFTWHASEKADEYTLRVSDSEDFPPDSSTMVFSEITGTFFTLPDSLDDDVWYYWQVRADNQSGSSTYSGTYCFITDQDASSVPERGPSPPAAFTATGTSPNPFRVDTNIEFTVERPHHVELTVYDVRGHVVRTLVDDIFDPGPHRVLWDGTDSQGQRVSPGVYLIGLRAGRLHATRKAVMLR